MSVHIPTKEQAERQKLAEAYMLGTLTYDQARWLSYELEKQLGWAALVTLTDEDVMESIGDAFVIPNNLRDGQLGDWVHDAVRKVASKWESPGHEWEGALEWAIELAVEYAKQDGVVLEKA